ncbi:extracellular solute-binding protein [Aerophototrophica crusticola]|uniref:Maltodextrin-binding protein n=2 Tax=Aerophototrophica crusticola TaxID=1709002 RepID=A0A858RBM3_9PROT|nr:extracellular solute-binding protein [Rhodospirillaceae bacterium B3]
MLAAAPAPALAQEAALTIWHAYRGQEKAAFDKAIALFNEQNKGKVAVKALAVPYDAYADKISAAVPRGTGPDAFIFAQDRLGGWVEAGGIVEPVDFFVEDKTKARFLPNMMDAMTYRGSIYGLPFNYKSIALIYNKAKVKEPPKTTKELLAWAKQNTNASTGQYGWAYPYNDFYYHAAVMNAFGGGVFKDGGAAGIPTPTVNAPQNVKAVETVMGWFKDQKVLPAEPSSALITSLFNEGKTSVVFSGPWFLGEVDKSIEVGVAPLPTVDEAGGTPMKPWMTIEGLYVSAKSKNKEAAYALADFLTTDPVAKIMAVEGRQQPTNKDVYAVPEVANDPILAGFRKQAETAVPMPNYAVMTAMWSPVTTAMNKIVKGSATVPQAFEEAQKTLSADIDALRKGR